MLESHPEKSDTASVSSDVHDFEHFQNGLLGPSLSCFGAMDFQVRTSRIYSGVCLVDQS